MNYSFSPHPATTYSDQSVHTWAWEEATRLGEAEFVLANGEYLLVMKRGA